MTELARPEHRLRIEESVARAIEPARAGWLPGLDAWAGEMDSAARIARALAPTPFVPKSLRVYERSNVIDVQGTTANIAAALLTGRELGMQPMGALRSIDIIDGTPALRALALRALLLRAGHDIWVVETTASRAIVTGLRAGSSHEQSSTWTIDRARTAGLAGKPNWRANPTAMLIARATAECARLVAPDVLVGLPYIAEELQDNEILENGGAPAEARGKSPARRTAQRRTPARPAASLSPAMPAPGPVEDEPPLDDQRHDIKLDQTSNSSPGGQPEAKPPGEATTDDQADEQDDFEQPITTRQMRKMHALFRTLDITERDDRLAFAAGVIHRDITTSTELSVAEAMQVIDELQDQIDSLQDSDDQDEEGDDADE